MIRNAQIAGTNIDPATYHQDRKPRGDAGFIMSPSQLKKFADCPDEWIATGRMIESISRTLEVTEDKEERKYLRSRLRELDPTTEAQRFGKLLDCLLLTPQYFESTFIVRPDTYEVEALKCPICNSVTEAARCRKCKVDRIPAHVAKPWEGRSETCQQLLAEWEADGLSVITKADKRRAVIALGRLMSKPECRRAVEVSHKQVHIVAEWHDRATGLVVPVQCLIDLAPNKEAEFIPDTELSWPMTLGDCKTSVVVDTPRFTRQVEKFGWHIQGAFDLDMFNAAAKEERDTWFFIGQKNYGTFQPFRKILSQKSMGVGRGAYTRILSNYCQCLKANKWPDADEAPDSLCGFGFVNFDDAAALREQMKDRYDFEEESEDEPEPMPDESDFTP